MATNEILPFATTDTGANQLTQANYQADAQRPIGNQPGVARQMLVNKVLKQVSVVAAGLAQYIADRQAVNVTDLLSATNFASYLENAIGSVYAPKNTPNFSGNVGIGVAGATSAIAIQRGAGQIAYIEVAGNANVPGSTSMLYGQDSANAGYVWNRANASVIFATNSLERARITGTGAMGIGTTAPAALLHVKQAGSANFGSGQFACSDTGANNSRLNIAVTNSGVNFIAGGTNTNPYFAFLTNDGNEESVRILNNGNFGIGHPAPAVKLHVRDNSAAAVNVMHLVSGLAGSGTLRTALKMGYDTDGYGVRIVAEGDPALAYPSSLIFERGAGSSTYAENARFDQSGNFYPANSGGQNLGMPSKYWGDGYVSRMHIGSDLVVGGGTVGSSGFAPGGAGTTGYAYFYGGNGVRNGFIGFGSNTATGDAGPLNYVAGSHNFTGSIVGNLTGNASTASNAMGVGQTWQDLTGSRTNGGTYTNSTGRSIMVTASGTGNGNSTSQVTINGSIVSYEQAQFNGSAAFGATGAWVIPAGATYSLSVAASLARWWELR